MYCQFYMRNCLATSLQYPLLVFFLSVFAPPLSRLSRSFLILSLCCFYLSLLFLLRHFALSFYDLYPHLRSSAIKFLADAIMDSIQVSVFLPPHSLLCFVSPPLSYCLSLYSPLCLSLSFFFSFPSLLCSSFYCTVPH